MMWVEMEENEVYLFSHLIKAYSIILELDNQSFKCEIWKTLQKS